ncbi:MAG: hypothetical protein EA382_11110 [Spirochaetaceae bacterium]|nr:MAG: hypothetical protein EA382_11110 [Spirochaetaceae bacterium]
MTSVKLWRLAFGMLAADRMQTILLLAVCIAAGVVALGYSEVSARRNAALESNLTRRYGTATVRRPVTSVEQIDSPHLAHRPHEPLAWLHPDDVAIVSDAAETLGFTVVPRIRGVAGVGIAAVEFIAIDRDDSIARENAPGRAGTATESTTTARGITAPLPDDADVVIAYQPTDDRVVFARAPTSAIIAVDPTPGPIWLDIDWIRGVLSGSTDGVPPQIANELALYSATGDPFGVAIDLADYLGDASPHLAITPWPEQAGVALYLATRSTSNAERLLVLIVAALAVIGITVLSVRGRTADVLVMSTIGLRPVTLIGLFARMMTIVGMAAAIAIGLIAIVVALSIGIESQPGVVRRAMLVVAAMPPLIAFLIVRRELNRPLVQLLREVGA